MRTVWCQAGLGPAFGWAALLWLAACGGMPEEDAVARLARATCARQAACSPYLVEQTYGDETTCVERVALLHRGTTSLVGTSLTPEKLAACADEIGAMPCETMLGARLLPAACEPTPGELSEGLTCGSDWQCQSAYCSRPAGGSCGVCKQRGRSRQPCDVDADCAPGMACREDECVTYGELDDSCDGTHPCAPGLHCAANVCVPTSALGESCDYGQSACDLLAGVSCVSSKCRPISLVPSGASCGQTDDAIVICARSGVCSMRTDGECLSAGVDGQACTRERCLPPAFCQGDVCRLPEPARCL